MASLLTPCSVRFRDSSSRVTAAPTTRLRLAVLTAICICPLTSAGAAGSAWLTGGGMGGFGAMPGLARLSGLLNDARRGDNEPSASATRQGSGLSLPALGGLTSNSGPREVAAAIIKEAQRRFPLPDIAILSTAMQESPLNPRAIGGGGAWHGIFEQDSGYGGRDDPNRNIAGFFNRLAAKGGPASRDMWKSIFWLQQAPGASSARGGVRPWARSLSVGDQKSARAGNAALRRTGAGILSVLISRGGFLIYTADDGGSAIKMRKSLGQLGFHAVGGPAQSAFGHDGARAVTVAPQIKGLTSPPGSDRELSLA
jgi:hypothetical protein